jgi:hypothetical protein
VSTRPGGTGRPLRRENPDHDADALTQIPVADASVKSLDFHPDFAWSIAALDELRRIAVGCFLGATPLQLAVSMFGTDFFDALITNATRMRSERRA